MFSILTLSLLSLASPGLAGVIVPRSGTLPPKFTVSEYSNDAVGFPNVYRDGGGGGTINGKNIIVFCDTTTTDGGPSGKMIGFTSNSAAYANADTPTSLTDFGSSGIPKTAVAYTTAEAAYTSKHFGSDGGREVLWPGSAITDVGNNIGVFAADIAVYGGPSPGKNYSTLVEVTASDSGPTFTRVVEKLFLSNEVSYGSFGTAKAWNGKLMLFGNTKGGIKIARVDPADRADRTKYEYWDGSAYTATMPSASSTSDIAVSGVYSSGDFYMSSYYRTWIFIYFNGYADSTFRMRYSLSGKVYGPYSDEQVLYKTSVPSGQNYNYAGHAYPSWDASGKTVTLSWTISGTTTKMAKVSWA
ncbi:uncharacterized protein BDZ99DRAFT_231473 [Mytilinidion resinicola]|uniref:DUF4185 domain-containing protein n=1 Tax=Mytilinidion resinicola TaxID=574789 RepID=A0A6A6Z1E3_9PEZI|nr:uncharacterized protein BDZ99DRAFT_231473 [Mytilinidion resinicola]KAF2814104.1 hypothetical protein BDZ99DRAFT_231473 [Mytilinidion resinicola]